MTEKKLVILMDVSSDKSLIQFSQDNSQNLILRKLSNGAMELSMKNEAGMRHNNKVV